MGKPSRQHRTTSAWAMLSLAHRSVLFGLLLAVAAVVGATSGGTLGLAPRSVAYAAASEQQSSTHVVVKLKPGATIEWLLQRVSTWRYGAGASAGYYQAVLEKTFPGSDIYLLRVTSGNAETLASRLPAQKAQVAWAEPGIFMPLAESSRFSPAAYERFSQAAFEGFRQTAYEKFSQAAYERFHQAAYEGFRQAAYERFSQAAFERFTQSAFESFMAVVYQQFRQAAYEQYGEALLDGFRQAVYERFSAAVYEQFRQAAYEGLTEADIEALLNALTALSDDPDFQLAFRELLEDLFESYQREYASRMESQPALAQIRALEAHSIARGAGVTVAVIDTGIYLNHWYLADSIAPGGVDLIDGGSPNDVGDGVDNDGNGYVDDGVGHGTYIAGLVRLVAPDAKLLPIRAIDDEGAGWSFIVAEAIYRAVDAGAQVINLSLSIPERSLVLQEALEYADRSGVVVVAAVGNGGEKLALYPATFDSVTGVAAVDSANRKADFSNYGTKSVAVAAPGVDLYGPYPAGTGFAWWSGTSFSSALVAGEAALVYEVNRATSGGRDIDGKVRRTIADSARSVAEYDRTYGGHLGKGLIDVLAAVEGRRTRK